MLGYNNQMLSTSREDVAIVDIPHQSAACKDYDTHYLVVLIIPSKFIHTHSNLFDL